MLSICYAQVQSPNARIHNIFPSFCRGMTIVLPFSIDEAIEIFSERGGDPKRAGKRHPLDPVVWMAHQGDDPSWESKFGLGRPGWHVECTAIAVHYLDSANADPIIQIQGGGSDLIFPHHYMSEQIVRAAYGRGFANNYVHSAMIHLDGEKMSKSKGNLVFVSQLLKDGSVRKALSMISPASLCSSM